MIGNAIHCNVIAVDVDGYAAVADYERAVVVFIQLYIIEIFAVKIGEYAVIAWNVVVF